MSKFVRYQPCPKCRSSGADRSGDNCAVYDDGSEHCFAGCGYHVFPKHVSRNRYDGQDIRAKDKAVLPADFSTNIPPAAWKWLLQYGLGYKYWQPHCGYSEKEQRLIFKVGNPVEFSIGRYIPQSNPSLHGERGVSLDGNDPPKEPRKWYVYGDSHRAAHIIGPIETSECIVLVEDLLSAHKVGQVTAAIPLFGTNVFPGVLGVIKHYGLPVVMWLDKDQQNHARKRAARLSLITGCKTTFVFTDNDPKLLSLDEIRSIVNEQV